MLTPEPSLVFTRELSSTYIASQMASLDEDHVIIAHWTYSCLLLVVYLISRAGSTERWLIGRNRLYLSLVFQSQAPKCQIALRRVSVKVFVEACPPKSTVNELESPFVRTFATEVSIAKAALFKD